MLQASVATYKSRTDGGAKQKRFGRLSSLQTGKLALKSTPLLGHSLQTPLPSELSAPTYIPTLLHSSDL